MNGSVIILGNYEAPRQFGGEIIFKVFFFKCWIPFLTSNILTDPSFYMCFFSDFISWAFRFFIWCDFIDFPLPCWSSLFLPRQKETKKKETKALSVFENSLCSPWSQRGPVGFVVKGEELLDPSWSRGIAQGWAFFNSPFFQAGLEIAQQC